MKGATQLLATLLFVALTALAAPKGSLLQRAPVSAQQTLNPLPPSGDNRRAGNKIFLQECAACHGRQALGKARIPPVATPMVRQAKPGTLYWILRNGSLCRGMPSFAHLPEDQRWQIITFLQSL